MMTSELNVEMAMPMLTRLGLRERLARATPADTLRGLLFNGALDLLRTSADEEAVRRCRLMLAQSRFFDFFNYSVFDFLRLAFNTAQYISMRQGGFEAALRQLGQRGMKDYLASMAGKAFVNFARDDARRLLTSTPLLFHSLTSYGERSLEWLGPRSCRLVMKRDFMPVVYQEGALHTLVEVLPLKCVRVKGYTVGPLDSEYLISWQ